MNAPVFSVASEASAEELAVLIAVFAVTAEQVKDADICIRNRTRQRSEWSSSTGPTAVRVPERSGWRRSAHHQNG